MKILAISAGTKNGTNDSMAKEALMGAKEQGAEVAFINLYDLNMKPCTGCVACVSSPKNGLMSGEAGDCVIRDDIDWLEQQMLEADGVIWAVPIFEKGAPAIIHIVQDRLCGPSHDPGLNTVAKMIAGKMGKPGPRPEKINKKLLVSFIAIGGSDWGTRVSALMNTMAMATMWKVVDDKVFQWSKSILFEPEKVAECRQVGVNIARAAAGDFDKAEYLGDPGICSNCHSRNFFIREGEAECEVCGAKGELKLTDGKYVFDFPESELEHVHNLIPGKMKHMDDIYKNESEFMERLKSPEYAGMKKKYIEFIEPLKP
jgi:multimeric flavodoxin WrbA